MFVLNGEYRAVAGSVDITPTAPIPLAGYAKVRKPVFERIADRLEANVLVVRDGTTVAAFVALDLMYVGPELHRRVFDAVSGRLPEDALFMSAIHTHSGPPTDVTLPVLGTVTPAYVAFAAERVAKLLTDLLEARHEGASLVYGNGFASHSVNRRLAVRGFGRDFPFFKQRIENRPNRSGPRDETIHLVKVSAADKPVAICWSYACHPVAYPELNDVSADFPGFVRTMLRSEFGDVPVLYWHGFSGDIRPSAPARALDESAGKGKPRFVHLSGSDWEEWSRGLGSCVTDVARQPGRPLSGALAASARSLPFSEFGPASSKPLTFREIRFGDSLSVCGVSAEVAVSYAEVLKKSRSPAAVIPVGCIDGVVGYLPTSEMVREGGYEAQSFLPRFGVSGRYRPDVTSFVEQRLFRPFTPAEQPVA